MLRNNLFTILIAIAIAYLSLAGSDNFDRVHIRIPGFDKFVHACMYFALMSSVVVENRRNITSGSRLLTAALVVVSYGILMEALQEFMTLSRSASFYDVLFDAAGIVLSACLFLVFKPFGIRLK